DYLVKDGELVHLIRGTSPLKKVSLTASLLRTQLFVLAPTDPRKREAFMRDQQAQGERDLLERLKEVIGVPISVSGKGLHRKMASAIALPEDYKLKVLRPLALRHLLKSEQELLAVLGCSIASGFLLEEIYSNTQEHGLQILQRHGIVVDWPEARDVLKKAA